MKQFIITLVVIGLLTLSGCDSKDAREYANELAGVLKSYQVEINKKIAAEQKSYKDLAATHAYARQVDLLSTLQTERFRRAESLTDELLGDGEITPSEMHELVADYANLDFESTRKMLEQESDGQAEYLASLESLELQSENIAALRKALEALAKPKLNIKQLKELGASAKEFKNKFDELQCEELGGRIACLKTQQAEVDKRTDLSDEQKKTAKEKIQKEIDSLLELTNEQKCDKGKRDKAECPDKKG